MFDFNKFVDSNIIIENDGNTTANTVDYDTLFQELKNKSDQDVARTAFVKKGEQLIDDFFIKKGKDYKGKWDGSVQAKGTDNITAKYIDAGYSIFKLIKSSRAADINNIKTIDDLKNYLTTLKPNDNIKSNIDQILQTFIKNPIDSYQCTDPLLKSIVGVDDLANLSLATYNGFTIYKAVVEMYKKRAGVLKSKLNINKIYDILVNPIDYASGKKALSDPIEQSLMDNGMYNERLQAIGVAALQYFIYLVNEQRLQSKTPTPPPATTPVTAPNAANTTTTQQVPESQRVSDNSKFFDSIVECILNEMTTNPSQAQPTGANKTQKQLSQDPKNIRRREQRAAKKAQALKATNIDLYRPETWRGISGLPAQDQIEYQNFIINGISNIVPQITTNEGNASPYIIGSISDDKSAQAQKLIRALQDIAQFKNTKKSLFQQFKQRMSYATQALDALAGMGGAKLYVGS